jgi:magnesium-transporting ATPase (P-type)
MLIPYNEGERRVSLIVHEKLGMTPGLLKKLATDARTGIIGDDRDLARRRHHFGANTRALPPVSRFWRDLVWNNLCQRLTLVLVILSAVTFLVALLGQEPWAWVEPLCILAVVAFTVLATSLFDHAQELQFRRLRAEIHNEACTVVRGQYGTQSKVPVRELVVGDLVVLQQGDLVPADCILIEEDDMVVDESSYNPLYKKDYRHMSKEISTSVE